MKRNEVDLQYVENCLTIAGRRICLNDRRPEKSGDCGDLVLETIVRTES